MHNILPRTAHFLVVFLREKIFQNNNNNNHCMSHELLDLGVLQQPGKFWISSIWFPLCFNIVILTPKIAL